MGGKNKFNAKARSNREVIIAPNKQVELDSRYFDDTKNDESNQLALPSKKRKTIVRNKQEVKESKYLSKKQRKKLEKIVERRNKKRNRAELLEELQKHQLPDGTYAKLTSLVQIQTLGRRKEKLLRDSASQESDELDSPGLSDDDEDAESMSLFEDTSSQMKKQETKRKGSIKGARKKKLHEYKSRFGNKFISSVRNQKVLGFSDSSEDEESDKNDGIEQDQEKSPKLEITEELKFNAYNERENSLANHQGSSKSESLNLTAVHEDKKINDEKDENSSKVFENIARLVCPERKRKTVVQVNRLPSVEQSRSKLPIITEEQMIMEAVNENLITVLVGETGSGKTTQIPQFLYEAGYASNGQIIGITEPRRVATIAMAQRVGEELNLGSEKVSYQIRFEGNVSDKTLVKFMTDGVLLKEMQKDFLLSKYSVICIDEAHERSLYTDILIGLLSRCVNLRMKRKNPLKLIIMSATMRVEDFVDNSHLFKSKPALINISSRQFPVQVHFTKHTPEDYISEVMKKTCLIHRKLPPGGILVFVTGQQEVKMLVRKLKKTFPAKGHDNIPVPSPKLRKSSKNIIPANKQDQNNQKGKRQCKLKSFDLDKIDVNPLRGNEEEEEADDEEEVDNIDICQLQDDSDLQPLHVLPLYSMLPVREQKKIFEPVPEGNRLCVVATNVAETSLTIPSIRYVVDCGKEKIKMWDKVTGVQEFRVTWCSKASADQRTGRAGRTGPGQCYRLFSSAIFDAEFEQFSKPEIQRRPVDDMLLLMKSINIDRVENFPFPSAPASQQIKSAEEVLLALGALKHSSEKVTVNGKVETKNRTVITRLGQTMAYFPVGPRFGKLLALSFHHNVLEHAIALASAMTVQQVLLETETGDGVEGECLLKQSWKEQRRKWAGHGSTLLLGDPMILLCAIYSANKQGGSYETCSRLGLRHKAIVEIRKLMKQLTNEINLVLPEGQEICLNPSRVPPTPAEADILRQIILSAFPDRIGMKVDVAKVKPEERHLYKHAYLCGGMEEPIFIHPSSVLHRHGAQWLVYQEIYESRGKMYMRGNTTIEPEWIPTFCQSMCNLGKPLEDPPPFYDEDSGTINAYVEGTYGKQGWKLPAVAMELPSSAYKYKLLAQFLLEGKIFEKMSRWSSNLLSLPATMTKPWARLQPRTETFLARLVSEKIESKKKLARIWSSDKEFLLKEYVEWVPEKIQNEVRASWPPL